jgi:phage terminase large subunit-like protein
MNWAGRAVKAYKDAQADRVVAEVNNGGEMVEALLRVVDPNVSYTAVHATRGKTIRAEPIAALYEQGRVHHVGTFGPLEDQMCDWDPLVSTKSPDRMDALVWALTELSAEGGGQGLLDYMREMAEANKPKERTA